MLGIGLLIVATCLMVLIQPETLLNLRNVYSDLKYDGFTWLNFKRAVKKHLIY
ncbi:hypothetical protein [Lapidilactobacillus gannanensis]|jgi:hypothetical protein|uniref:Uncharacterized protein n=1 Tax=Lapidilactobacillus gannanensis TaxID=2486002 RepID=A0ABW4BQ44_9LACO|nr:hypothetical protein [Lapidilactobacillus gannanensis]MCH4056940.1 hypothetical protein [Lactobacillaceae bacterium]